ncbi:hypothetical protein SAMN04487827_1374 [Prevotella sp. khp7]|uniref:hypothetical protein n=1 Tax=Prevotella sp. khp7 TaxID=1761885 RepID=UPI0008D4FBAA|nr:hypothetical protein [Prevotella sp. khp7]SEW03388.1 hypothetical protein SAMN04487827_1374 [Prevotella sp. khp7]
MNKIVSKIVCAWCIMMVGMSFTACNDDAWGNDNPETQNVFYFGFQDWGRLDNKLAYTVAQGQTLDIPVQFWCAGSRAFDAESFYYVDSNLTLGADYQIVDANGTSLQPNANGAFSMKWQLTGIDATDNHRVQSIYFKALNGAKGDVTVTTFDPKDVDADDKVRISNGSADGVIYTPNNINNQYEVHCFTQNYKVKVTIQ